MAPGDGKKTATRTRAFGEISSGLVLAAVEPEMSAQLKAMMLIVQSVSVRRELADGLGIAPSAATPLVNRLVEQKLARREDNPDNGAASGSGRRRRHRGSTTSFPDERGGPINRSNRRPAGRRAAKVHDSVRLLLESAERVLEVRRSALVERGLRQQRQHCWRHRARRTTCCARIALR